MLSKLYIIYDCNYKKVNIKFILHKNLLNILIFLLINNILNFTNILFSNLILIFLFKI